MIMVILMMISSEKIRKKIKESSFEMRDIALVLNNSERNLYYKLKNEKLTIKEINVLCKILNLDIEDMKENE